MKTILKHYCNWSLVLLLIILILTIVGKITFGRGLGDIYYMMIIIIQIAIIIFIKFLLNNTDLKIAFILFYLIITFFVGYTIYNITFGRGLEYPWKGNVFYEQKNKQ